MYLEPGKAAIGTEGIGLSDNYLVLSVELTETNLEVKCLEDIIGLVSMMVL